MKLLLIPLLLTVCLATQTTEWDYLLFVQVWPGSWIKNPTTSNFNNTYFTIHGLWPEYLNSTWPQFCNRDKFNFTAIQNISQDLKVYWTNFENPKTLWIHEYQKHATCAESDPLLTTEYLYFSTGLNLRNKYDIFDSLKNNSITPSNSIKYPTLKLVKVLANLFNHPVVVICDKNNILNEIRFCLDKNLEQFDCPTSEMNEQCQQDYIIYNLVT